jgi:NADH-quinone oxidoreductase subunit L
MVIQALNNEHEIWRMGGLRRQLPIAFWTFIVGAASLSAVPFVTAGFFSKDTILLEAWSSPFVGPWLWVAGTAGAAITSLYASRLVLVVFFGQEKTRANKDKSLLKSVPLVVLAFLSVFGGLFELPHSSGAPSLMDLLRRALPGASHATGSGAEMVLTVVSSLVSLGGIFCAVLFYRSGSAAVPLTRRNRVLALLSRFCFNGWGFDRLYDATFVRPYVRLSRLDKDDFVDRVYKGLARLATLGNSVLAATQSGLVRWYVMALAAGAVVLLGIVVFW